MSDFLERIAQLSPRRLALLAVELNAQLEQATAQAQAQATEARKAERQPAEPIAVVGIGCRFPGGGDSPERFWEILRDGRDCIREVPAQRWAIDDYYDPDPDAPAAMSTRHGGFLDAVDGFDAAFFGVSPREALTMDPQQRLLLEVSWEALEHAGIAAERLAGSATGVYLGVCNGDHFQRVIQRGSDLIDAYLASGNAHSVTAGRIAYFLGLQGPALAIDTACSSSLVALHVACQSLRNGEVRLALAGGVNVMCSPETTIALTKAHMLAPDGRCKTFDAAADGFSRGEGCGVVVLKRLADALADGDRVLALVRGNATNQDGRSGGLTVPNGPAQEAVIRAALAQAGVEPADIDYVEAHGTGTSLGDPIEVRALAGALGAGRPADAPLLAGSVKTNIGHLESAAGIAGVIKVVMSLQHGLLPPHLHFREPSPRIAWHDYPVAVTAAGRPWSRSARPRRAGVSSFGFSGTNAHVVLEEAPAAATRQGEAVSQGAADRPLHCYPLSARTPAALRQLARQHAEALAASRDAPSFCDAAHTAAVGRSHLAERLAIAAASAAEAAAALQSHARGEPHPLLHRGVAEPGQPLEVVFLFTGQGAQYPGMGRALYDASPVFREVIDHCDAVLGRDADGWTLKSVLWPAAQAATPIHETAWTQPALFAVEYAMSQTWRSWGIEPAAVIGHSVGEYVAACVAGVFTLDEGLRLIAARGRLMQALPPGGAMAAVFTAHDEVARAIAGTAGELSIAAINAPDSVVVSGKAEAVDDLLQRLASRDVQGQRLLVSLAAHSALVEPALDAMQACAAAVTMKPPRIPVAWNLAGDVLAANQAPDATYWRRHLREPVQFATGIEALHRDGYRAFLEVGPHPTLLALAQRSLPEEGTVLLASLRRGHDDWQEVMASLCQLHVHGARVDWVAFDRPYSRRRVALPTYPFERQSFWIPAPSQQLPRPRRLRPAAGLPGERLPTALPIFETVLDAGVIGYLAEHRLNGTVLVPGGFFLELAQAASRTITGSLVPLVEGFVIHEPLRLDETPVMLQTQLQTAPQTGLQAAPGGEAMTFSIHGRAAGDEGEWRLHASGRLVAGAAQILGSADGDPARCLSSSDPAASSLDAAESFGPACDGGDFYRRLADLGIDLGPRFRSVREIRQRDGEALVAVSLSPSCRDDPTVWTHPALLDGAFQAAGLAVPAAADDGDIYLLSGVGAIQLAEPLPPSFQCHARLRPASERRPREWLADVDLAAPDGSSLGRLRGVSLRRARISQVTGPGAQPRDPSRLQALIYRPVWEALQPADRLAPALRAPAEFAAALRREFEALSRWHGLSVYDTLLPELDRLSTGFVVAALRELGFDERRERHFDAAGEAHRLGIAARHLRLFSRLLEILAEDGLLSRHGDNFSVAAFADQPALPAGQLEALLERFGDVDGELRMLRRCGQALGQVLRGQVEPLHLLFPGGAFDEARKLYVDSPYARTYNGAMAAAIAAAIAQLPAGGRLRMLEIGAGTGGTTSFVLPLLPAGRVDYTFTDLSPLFLERATEQFGGYPFLSTALLDIEQDPAAQGFASAGFDIVIAANVLHATADLAAVLQHVRSLLAPQGLLFLLEGVAPERWVDLTFGLTEGWWRFADAELRGNYPLISRQRWLELLQDAGFCDAIALPESGEGRGQAQQALLAARAPRLSRQWALVGDGGGIGAALAQRLAARGEQVVRLDGDASPAAVAATDVIVHLAALELADRAADDAAACELAGSLACTAPLALLGEVGRSGRRQSVWLVTRGVHAVATAGSAAGGEAGGKAGGEAGVSAGAQWQAPLWGAGRVFALEHPQAWGGLVDLPAAGDDAAQADLLLSAIDADDGEDQAAWREGRRHVLRLVPAGETPGGEVSGGEVSGLATETARPLEEAADRRFESFDPEATYLVTGGYGGLGLVVAQWMAQRGARHLALLGRRPDPRAPGVAAIEAQGACVHHLQADLGDEAGLRACLERLAAAAPPLRGIVHAAADLSAAPVIDLQPAQVQAMLRPKLQGTVLLERLARSQGLEFLVLFSSTTALLGATGLAHYAAANAFLDAFARCADRPGRRVVSIDWGVWDVMRLASADQQQAYRDGGHRPMPAPVALAALAQALGDERSNVVVADIDWQIYRPLHEARRRRPLLARLGGRSDKVATADAAADEMSQDYPAGAGRPAAPAAPPALIAQLDQAPPEARRNGVGDFVSGAVGKVLGLDPRQPVATTTGLFDLGMDSLMSVELKGRLERGTGLRLPATLTFNYPNVAALAGCLLKLLPEAAAAAAAGEAGRSPQRPGQAAMPASSASPQAATAPLGLRSEGAPDLDELSDDELESRLLARLEQAQ